MSSEAERAFGGDRVSHLGCLQIPSIDLGFDRIVCQVDQKFSQSLLEPFHVEKPVKVDHFHGSVPPAKGRLISLESDLSLTEGGSSQSPPSDHYPILQLRTLGPECGQLNV